MEQKPETKQIEQPHSTEISINQKGNWSGSIKCYGSTPDDAFQTALKKALDLEKLIKEKNTPHVPK